MFKFLSQYLKVGILSLTFMSLVSSPAFANDEKEIPKGIGETIVTSEERATGTASSPFESSLSIGNQIINGRNWVFGPGYHNISMKLIDRLDSDGNNKCRVTLKRVSVLSESTIGYKDLNLVKVGSTYSAKFGSKQPAGTYKYTFDNRASTFGWDNVDHISAKPVKMFITTS